MQGILTLDYSQFAGSAEERLALLVSIQVVLGKIVGTHRASHLGLSPEQWRVLYRWIAAGGAEPFWRTSLGGITVFEQPRGHIIVGTNELMRDLAAHPYFKDRPDTDNGADSESPTTNSERAELPLHSLDSLWKAALSYEKTHTTLSTQLESTV